MYMSTKVDIVAFRLDVTFYESLPQLLSILLFMTDYNRSLSLH